MKKTGNGNITNAEVIAEWSIRAKESVMDFGEEGDFARHHLLNPTLLALLGDVRGRKVLDAGCGNGYFARLLAKKGGIVTGVEPALYRLAVEWEQAAPQGVFYLEEDLSLLLSRLPHLSGAFDTVVCNLVLQDIPDCDAAIANCLGCLRPGGDFVFSILHPCFEDAASVWAAKGYVSTSEYFERRAIPQGRFGYFFHRPLSYYLNAVAGRGGHIRAVVEPQLKAAVPSAGKAFERDRYIPSFFVVRATRDAQE
jgi:2-polyprenyl-3-methyl-5-hydroxy-6-metoxy-1,4-benzoquinol methylase